MAREVMTGASGRVTGVAYYDEGDRLHEQTADIVIVSSAAGQNPLLRSRSASKPPFLRSSMPNFLGLTIISSSMTIWTALTSSSYPSHSETQLLVIHYPH